MRKILGPIASIVLLAAAAAPAHAQISVLGSFNAGLGGLEGVGYDPFADRVWAYGGGTTISRFTPGGMPQGSVPNPGESANDVDIEITPTPMTLAGEPLPAGTLLFINGEINAAEVYAIDKASGTLLATLNTAFGNDHVVGGAYHPGRGTLFLVQDNVTASGAPNRVAEINPLTGAVINSFSLSGLFDVNFGDLDVGVASGNLFLVSSVEDGRMAEITPTGTLVRYITLPAGPVDLSGLALDDFTGEAWVSGTGGMVWRLGDAVAAIPEPQTYALLLAGLGLLGFAARRRRSC